MNLPGRVLALAAVRLWHSGAVSIGLPTTGVAVNEGYRAIEAMTRTPGSLELICTKSKPFYT